MEDYLSKLSFFGTNSPPLLSTSYMSFHIQIQVQLLIFKFKGESIITGLIAGVTALTLLLLNAIGLIILRRRRTKSVNVAN